MAAAAATQTERLAKHFKQQQRESAATKIQRRVRQQQAKRKTTARDQRSAAPLPLPTRGVTGTSTAADTPAALPGVRTHGGETAYFGTAAGRDAERVAEHQLGVATGSGGPGARTTQELVGSAHVSGRAAEVGDGQPLPAAVVGDVVGGGSRRSRRRRKRVGKKGTRSRRK